MRCCTYTNKVCCSERSWPYLHVLFESLFCLTKLFKYGDGAKLLRLCWNKCWTTLCRTLQCDVLIRHLPFCQSAGLWFTRNNFWNKWFKFITALLNNVRRVGELVLSRAHCIIIMLFFSYHRFSFFPGTSPLEPVVNLTTQASSLSL
jgi:hypothetical protein